MTREAKELDRRVRNILDPWRGRLPMPRVGRLVGPLGLVCTMFAAVLVATLAHGQKVGRAAPDTGFDAMRKTKLSEHGPGPGHVTSIISLEAKLRLAFGDPDPQPDLDPDFAASLPIFPRGDAPRHVAQLTRLTTVATTPHQILGRQDQLLHDVLASEAGDRDPVVRARVKWALAQERNGALVAPLRGALRVADWDRRASAAWALGQLPDAASLEALVQSASDADANVRLAAIYALGHATDVRALAALKASARDTIAEVRALSIASLGRLGTMDALAIAQRGLRDADPTVRAAAIEALARIKRAGE